MDQTTSLALGEAFSQYLATYSGEDPAAVQQELARFVRWYGRDKDILAMTPPAVEDYCTTLEGTGEWNSQRLAVLKGFLSYLHHQGWTQVNMAPHAKVRRSTKKTATSQKRARPTSARRLTADGFKRLQEELESLKADRVQMVEEIRKAAATKDFSENAPLDAAREHQSRVESRIRELEEVFKGAAILDNSQERKSAHVKAAVGSRILLRHVMTGQEISYLLVESREANPGAGKLSIASPVGKALLNRAMGDEVEVTTPRGMVRYLISNIGI